MELIFHQSEKNIEEDIFFYTSDQRDKHSMIKPEKENLISMTIHSENLSAPDKNNISNVFYPFKKNSIDKIYIGLSFPLFSNNWGASYLRYLLKIIKKDGSIILPVYPEGQAYEKGMWSRSFLENIFTSRTGWTGRNNVWAENDGVMSMRIGKKFPKKPDSTLNYYLDEIGNQFYRDQVNDVKNNSIKMVNNIWHTSFASAIIEKIIQDKFKKKKIVYADICKDPSLAFEVSVSDYINVIKTIICSDNNNTLCDDFINYFSHRNNNIFIKSTLELENLIFHKPDIVSIMNLKTSHEYIKVILTLLPETTIIFHGTLDSVIKILKNKISKKRYKLSRYSSIVAAQICKEHTMQLDYDDSDKDFYMTLTNQVKNNYCHYHYSDIIQKAINTEIENFNWPGIYVLTPE